MNRRVILSIDCGTQSLRAMLFSETGHLVGKAQIAYTPYASPQPGWAEQDAEIYWNALCDACQKLKRSHAEPFARIAGVGVTTQRNSMVNVDRNGTPLRPAILWLDQRKAAPRFGQRGPLHLGLRLMRMDRLLNAVQAEGKCNWIRQNQPMIWSKTHRYLQISGFLNHRLTGRFADATASQIGHLPFHYKHQRWARPFELCARLFPVESDKLPDLVAPGTVLGTVTATAAQQTGLARGLTVIACGSDKGCETIGSGVLDQTMASLSFGTTATVQTTARKYFEPISMMPPYPAPVPGHYNPEVEIFRGFWMISWFKKEFAHEEVLEANRQGIAPEELLNRHLVNTTPGAMGLMVQPFWGPGLRQPAAKGAMIGFGDVHTKAHVYRAVIEGLGFALREGLEKLESKGKRKVQRAAVSGGASQSDEICQIAADIFNLPMVRGRTHETSGLGAAMVTAAGLGWYGSVKEAGRNMVAIRRIFEPNPVNVTIYNRLYRRVYRRIYKALAPLYQEIQEITGYPG